MFGSIVRLFKQLFPIFFASQLAALPVSGYLANRTYRTPFTIPYRTNGASRRKKTNRLRLSTKTRNKHR